MIILGSFESATSY